MMLSLVQSCTIGLPTGRLSLISDLFINSSNWKSEMEAGGKPAQDSLLISSSMLWMTTAQPEKV